MIGLRRHREAQREDSLEIALRFVLLKEIGIVLVVPWVWIEQGQLLC